MNGSFDQHAPAQAMLHKSKAKATRTLRILLVLRPRQRQNTHRLGEDLNLMTILCPEVIAANTAGVNTATIERAQLDGELVAYMIHRTLNNHKDIVHVVDIRGAMEE